MPADEIELGMSPVPVMQTSISFEEEEASCCCACPRPLSRVCAFLCVRNEADVTIPAPLPLSAVRVELTKEDEEAVIRAQAAARGYLQRRDISALDACVTKLQPSSTNLADTSIESSAKRAGRSANSSSGPSRGSSMPSCSSKQGSIVVIAPPQPKAAARNLEAMPSAKKLNLPTAAQVSDCKPAVRRTDGGTVRFTDGSEPGKSVRQSSNNSIRQSYVAPLRVTSGRSTMLSEEQSVVTETSVPDRASSSQVAAARVMYS